MMQRTAPAAHLGIDKSAGIASTNARDMSVMIDQLLWIDVRKRALHQVAGTLAQAALQLLRLVLERAADVMKQAHV